MRHTRIGLMVDGNVCTGEEMLFLKTGFVCCFCYEKCRQISLNAQRQCTESCSVAMRSYPGNDFESRRQNEALLHVEFPVVMKLPIFIKGKVRLQSSELLQKSVYPNSKRIPMWQTGITGVGALLLTFVSLIYYGNCIHDIKRDALIEDSFNLRRASIRQHAQQSFKYRNEDLNNFLDVSIRSKNQNSEKLMLADGCVYQQLPNMQPRAKLCCHPVVSSSSSGQTKVDNIGSRSILLESSSVRSSSGPVLPSNSEAVLPPVNHVPMYPPESSLSYNLHPPNMLQPSSASTVFQSPHMPLLSLPFAVQPSPPLVQSAVYPSPPVSLPDISPEVQEILNSPLPSLHPSMPQKVSTVVQLDAMPPISQPSKQSNDRLGSFQAYAPFTTPSSFVSPAFLPKDLPKILTNPTHAESVPRINSLVRSPYQSPSQPRSSLSFLPFPPSPVTTQRSTPVHAAASLHAPGRSKLLVPPMQSGQYPEHLPIGRVTPALAPIEPLEMVAPPLVQAYNTPSPKPSSQSLQPPKRPHFEKIMPALAPSWPLPVTVPPLVPFNNRRSPQPSSQSFVSPVKQSSATVVPPLSAQSLPIFSPSVPHSQGSSGYKFHPPEVVSSIMAGRSLPPTLAHPVTIPPSVSFHGQRHQPRHSVLHPVVPDASNSFPKHLTPMLFNDPSPALLPVVHSRASFSPTVHGNIVPASLKKRQRSPLGTTPTTPPTTVPASLSIHGSVPSPQSLDPPSAPRKRSGRLAPIALAPTIQENVSSPENSVPSSPRKKRSRRHAGVAMAPMSRGSVSSPPINFPSESPMGSLGKPLLAPTLIFPFPSHHHGGQGSIAASPSIVSSDPHRKKPRKPLATSPMKFPPPPPDQDCTAMTCIEPLTSTPLGSPCGCVLPMQVELELGVAPYAFFPLVSELAAEISAGTYLKQSQVRIMGANADGQDQEKTFVNIDLVPLGEKFDMTTALLTWDRFWQKKMIINATFFGDYRVIFIRYPGLPASPPSSNATLGSPSGVPGRLEPFGVEVKKRSEKMGGGTIAVVALSSAVAMVICLGAIWLILLKCSKHSMPALAVAPTLTSSVTKRSGGGSILSSSMASSTSLSFASSMATYMGSAKTFTLAELEKATDRFNDRNILGEGGFGRVYRGVLDDGTLLAVKILTRDDQQGGREFIAEIEMLSRLHHRNLVKLIGICTEEHNRCLVYELIPNGSVESHLHGHDKVTAPLDWDARMKIALGAARGLAYLHEDSNPRVIHRDFKASNILLEDDFTPKVSDFGLAKAASDEGSGHISTRVMGTFGYVAPEYAMTGHLLVKSDVYSYGVVLLELLSGRKPVDMSQPPGQENLVTWARPLLTTKEGLELLVDPALGGAFTFDNMARVAAIASMCVQPEVSHRPFMGEVVQALKLVYNDSDTSNGGGSGIYSQGDSPSPDNELNEDSGSTWWPSTQYIPHSTSFVTIDYDSGPLQTQVLETERPLSASALLSSSGRFMRQPSGSFRRHSSSGPLRTLRSKPSWYRVWGLTGGSMSEHGLTNHFGSGLDREVHDLWP